MKYEKLPCVYILTNQYNTTLYVGVTANLSKRINQHKNKVVDGFTKRYNLNKLVYFEVVEDMYAAINYEKYLKGKTRQYKIDLINKTNPKWEDLSDTLV